MLHHDVTKVVQVEHNGKKKAFFIAFVETPPTFDRRSTVVQVEHNGKKKTFFIAIAEAPPTFDRRSTVV
jgi:hypothetical protein